MPRELSTLLSEFPKLGANFCKNAKKLSPSSEVRKILDIYEAGLNASLAGLSTCLREQYDTLTSDQKKGFDRMVALSGALPMLKKANEIIGEHSIADREVLVTASGIFEKIKEIIRDILEYIIGPGEITELIKRLLKWIDMIIENITGAIKEKPPASQGFHTWQQQVIGCVWFDLYSDPNRKKTFILNHPGNGTSAELEIEVDGNMTPPLNPPDATTVHGNRIRLHLKGDSSQSGYITVTELPF